MILSRRKRCAWHAAHIREEKYAYKILVVKP
jgi:hypothetical protein